MQKKIFAACFILMCCFIFIKCQVWLIDNEANILKVEDKEETIESAFPLSDTIKEIYGYSNLLLSPNEKITGNAATIKDADGFLEHISSPDTAVVDKAKVKISELNEICHSSGKEFAFINYPSKSNSRTKSTEYGIETNSEAIRADFLNYLNRSGIDYLDVRELLENDGYTTKDIFYKTDHHWKTPAGLYAARAITNFMNEKYGWNLNSPALEDDQFTFKTYENLWFGETGRNLSLAWVGVLDDFTEITPNYETSLTLSYSDGTTESGDFSILIDSSGYNGDVDYYNYSAHYSYKGGMSTLLTFHNNNSSEDSKKILVIKDSFSTVVVPFLTLATSDVTVWDMRLDPTKEGLYQYISDNDYDIVLLAYTDFWQDKMWNFN